MMIRCRIATRRQRRQANFSRCRRGINLGRRGIDLDGSSHDRQHTNQHSQDQYSYAHRILHLNLNRHRPYVADFMSHVCATTPVCGTRSLLWFSQAAFRRAIQPSIRVCFRRHRALKATSSVCKLSSYVRKPQWHSRLARTGDAQYLLTAINRSGWCRQCRLHRRRYPKTSRLQLLRSSNFLSRSQKHCFRFFVPVTQRNVTRAKSPFATVRRRMRNEYIQFAGCRKTLKPRHDSASSCGAPNLMQQIRTYNPAAD